MKNFVLAGVAILAVGYLQFSMMAQPDHNNKARTPASEPSVPSWAMEFLEERSILPYGPWRPHHDAIELLFSDSTTDADAIAFKTLFYEEFEFCPPTREDIQGNYDCEGQRKYGRENLSRDEFISKITGKNIYALILRNCEQANVDGKKRMRRYQIQCYIRSYRELYRLTGLQQVHMDSLDCDKETTKNEKLSCYRDIAEAGNESIVSRDVNRGPKVNTGRRRNNL